jgi:hypothetical protein
MHYMRRVARFLADDQRFLASDQMRGLPDSRWIAESSVSLARKLDRHTVGKPQPKRVRRWVGS